MTDPAPPSRRPTAPEVLHASWPVPGCTHAATTLRGSLPASPAADEGFDVSHLAPAEHRGRLGHALDLPSEPFWLRQVHGTTVADIASATAAVEADAAVCHAHGRVLAVLSADCLPVALCHPNGNALGIAHAGWRGLAAGVIEHTVNALRAPPAECIAWLGPAIGPAAFEVGEEVRDAFLAADHGCGAAFVGNRPGHWLADLYTLARRRLASAGVREVHGGGECTFGMPERYFSYRRDRTRARMATLLWRTGDDA